MNKTGQVLVNVIMVLASALLASGLMLAFSPNDSWLAFAGWMIFFVAIQSPLFIFTQSSQGSCTAWFSRLRKRS